ncbi:hypothetical protein AJ78_04490 [Emergomyces pasteurianus Ep9510]|uniref:Uncharacterized protein n=1 Tax=Emergomyces pasteurianus Ep9510 TaxID=1447872 RepID=A0A1J9PGV2_9EURO|nr:hypothetical protein AJ78_04490 [Emergomyces pasteurianus Ep9510]
MISNSARTSPTQRLTVDESTSNNPVFYIHALHGQTSSCYVRDIRRISSRCRTNVQNFPKHPKRVILRLRVNEFDGRSPTEFDHAIKAYLASAGRPVDELTQRIHYSHIEPFQPPELKQRSFHIVQDIEKDMFSDPDFDEVKHEVHRIRRAKNGTFKVDRISNPVEEQNFVRQMRHFTDTFYPWAK